MWAIDSVGLVIATCLLTLRYFRLGIDVVAAGLFAVTAARIFAGEVLLPTASPLPFFAYPFLVATLVGWAWMLLREESARRA